MHSHSNAFGNKREGVILLSKPNSLAKLTHLHYHICKPYVPEPQFLLASLSCIALPLSAPLAFPPQSSASEADPTKGTRILLKRTKLCSCPLAS